MLIALSKSSKVYIIAKVCDLSYFLITIEIPVFFGAVYRSRIAVERLESTYIRRLNIIIITYMHVINDYFYKASMLHRDDLVQNYIELFFSL